MASNRSAMRSSPRTRPFVGPEGRGWGADRTKGAGGVKAGANGWSGAEGADGLGTAGATRGAGGCAGGNAGGGGGKACAGGAGMGEAGRATGTGAGTGGGRAPGRRGNAMTGAPRQSFQVSVARGGGGGFASIGVSTAARFTSLPA